MFAFVFVISIFFFISFLFCKQFIFVLLVCFDNYFVNKEAICSEKIRKIKRNNRRKKREKQSKIK